MNTASSSRLHEDEFRHNRTVREGMGSGLQMWFPGGGVEKT